MKFSKFIVIPIIIAVLAAIAQLIDQLLQASNSCDYFISNTGFCWLTFQAWALYFLAGCTVRGGLNVLLGYTLGILGSIAIIMFAGWLSGIGISQFWATPLSIAILVIPIICFERIKVMVPALFVGSGAYFAIMTFQAAGEQTTFLNAAITELIYCILGLILGWISISLRVAYEARVNKSK